MPPLAAPFGADTPTFCKKRSRSALPPLLPPLPVLRCDRDDAIDFSVRATERAAATAARTAACALCVAAAAASAAAFDAAETDALLSATGIVDSGASMRTGLDSSVAVA